MNRCTPLNLVSESLQINSLAMIQCIFFSHFALVSLKIVEVLNNCFDGRTSSMHAVLIFNLSSIVTPPVRSTLNVSCTTRDFKLFKAIELLIGFGGGAGR